MGLDISAYSNAEFLGFGDEYDESREDDAHVNQEHINPYFTHAVPEGWVDHSYAVFALGPDSDYHSFRAGSYSGYGLFRGTLSSYSLGVDSYNPGRAIPLSLATVQAREDAKNAFWDNLADGQYDHKVFVKLINFSDCEGMFYGPVCEELYQEFVTYEQEYKQWVSDYNPYEAWSVSRWHETYDNFKCAFDLARHNGVVSFH